MGFDLVLLDMLNAVGSHEKIVFFNGNMQREL